MAHLVRDKRKLLHRIRRIQGQVNAIEKILENADDHECSSILQLLAACRGAINGLMNEVMDGHVRFHLLNPDKKPTSSQAKAAEELLAILKTYLK